MSGGGGMPGDDYTEAAKLAGALAVAGGAVRVALALRAGVRRAGLLLIEGVVGMACGPLCAGLLLWVAPSITDGEHGLLKLLAVAGLGGAVGLRALLLAEDELRRRVGAKPRDPGEGMT
jgi:hypothetical protein